VIRFSWAVLSLSLLALHANADSAQNQSAVTVKVNGDQPSAVGSGNYFTGTVRIDSPFTGTEPARVSGATVTFEPGARTAWHTHPLGQTLIVTAGSGWVQEAGKPAQRIRPGDTVWIPPNVLHWHGATATTAMTHIAIAESLQGKVVDWKQQVSEQEYAQAAVPQ